MRRSMLFMPGNNAGMLLNADILGADAVILDLEDAVSPAEKDAARILVRNAIQTLQYQCQVCVRINSIDTGFWKQDLEEILPLQPDLIMPPKISSAQDVLTVDAYMTELEQKLGLEAGKVKLIPLIETALGVENAFAIAGSCPRVTAMLLGGEDLTADLQCKRTKEGQEIFYSRSRIVVAARAAGVDCYDTPFTDVNDDEGLRKDAAFAKALGFTGKSAISPRHVADINAAFSPTMADIEYAEEVMETIRLAKEQGKGVVSLRGKMIDAPIVTRARQVLEMAEAMGVRIHD